MIQAVAVPLLVDTLIKYGTSKISDKKDAELVQKIAKETFNVALDMNRPAVDNIAVLRPFIKNELDNLSALAMEKSSESLDKLPDEVANSTLVQMYPSLQKPAKVIVWVMVAMYLTFMGGTLYELMSNEVPLSIMTAYMYVFYCLGGLIAVAIIPIRPLAYILMGLASAKASDKVNKK